MLTTGELYELLWKDSLTSKYVMAVVQPSALKYISADHKQRCYIVNCNEKAYSHLNVGHWFILTVGEAHFGRSRGSKVQKYETVDVEVFDSQGVLKEYNKDIKTFIKQFGRVKVYSKHISDCDCGYYSLIYAYYRSRGYDAETVVNILTDTRNVKDTCLKLFNDSV